MIKYLLKMKSNLHSHVLETVERVPATTITITSPYWNLVAMVDTQYKTPSGVKLANENNPASTISATICNKNCTN